MELREISTAELGPWAVNGTGTILDLRSPDAYNGWRVDHRGRGGHIAGARSFPARWIEYLDWPDILGAKGIAASDPVVFYGSGQEEMERVAASFHRAGFENIGFYRGFLNEWTADERLPMERLPRYRHLVPPWWAKSLTEGDQPCEYENDRYVICHVHYRNRRAYEEGHVPGAVEVDTNCLESPETWNRRSPPELKAALEQLGITRDSTVILYGRDSMPGEDDPFPGSSAGQLAAMRCAFILLYAGVRDIRILNGGLQAWEDAGYPISREETPRRPAPDFGGVIPGCPELAVDLEEAKEILRSPDANLVSVRSRREDLGEVSGYNYIEKKGRIPGSVFANGGSDAYHMEHYRNFDGTMREYHEIERMWQLAGVTPERHNAFYCGTGWRGSEAFFDAWLLGWPRVAVYDGGWYEWSRDGRNPVETGLPAGVALS